jgi:hypothetical protein
VEAIDAGIAALCPLKRVAVPQDIGRVVAFLASAESEWINGMPFLKQIKSDTDLMKAKCSSSVVVLLRRMRKL